MYNTLSAYERAQIARNDIFKKYPVLVNAVVTHLDPDDLEVQSLELWTLADGRQIYFYETPGHGHFFDLLGNYIGEEDGGLFNGGRQPLENATIKDII